MSFTEEKVRRWQDKSTFLQVDNLWAKGQRIDLFLHARTGNFAMNPGNKKSKNGDWNSDRNLFLQPAAGFFSSILQETVWAPIQKELRKIFVTGREICKTSGGKLYTAQRSVSILTYEEIRESSIIFSYMNLFSFVQIFRFFFLINVVNFRRLFVFNQNVTTGFFSTENLKSDSVLLITNGANVFTFLSSLPLPFQPPR